jgi:hypothetical protein
MADGILEQQKIYNHDADSVGVDGTVELLAKRVR